MWAVVGTKSEKLGKHLLVAAILAVAFYVCAFAFIQHLRVFKGPWDVAFVSDSTGQPSIVIAQRRLNILQTVRFAGARIDRTNLQAEVQFREAVTTLPFGEMLLQDPLYLPGTATMRLFGHVVELLPRTLIIDDKEYAWRSGKDVVVGEVSDVHSGEHTRHRVLPSAPSPMACLLVFAKMRLTRRQPLHARARALPGQLPLSDTAVERCWP